MSDNETRRLFPDAPGFKEKRGTSEDAAKLVAGIAPALRDRCFVLIEASAIGRTADEVANALDWDLCSIRARISELYAAGWVKKDGRRSNNRSRASTVVWKAVPKQEREAAAAHVRAEALKRARNRSSQAEAA